MGHLRLWRLPRTRKWDEVVALLENEGAGVGDIASASLDASKSAFEKAAAEPGLAYAFWLLTQIPLAARHGTLADDLRQLGVQVSENPSVLEIISGFAEAVERHTHRTNSESDIAEMALLSATESLTSLAGSQSADLFDASSESVSQAFRPYSTERNFGLFARDFFARFARRFLGYFLSRELSNHVGAGKRFSNIDQHSDFNEALDLHCRQAARIVQDFAGEWLTKTDYESGITQEKAGAFLHVAMGKLRSELTRESKQG